MARKVWNFEISYTFVYTKVQKKSEIKKKKIWIHILIWALTGLLNRHDQNNSTYIETRYHVLSILNVEQNLRI